MKKHILFFGVAAVTLFAACSNDDDNNPGPGPNPSSDTIMVRGKITADTRWSKDKVYKLRGYVYVDAPATLTIDAGTKIISTKDSAGVLMIYKGAKINAAGTATEPIVFTSGAKDADRTPGDLGGVIIVGNAVGNKNHKEVEGGVDAAYKAFGGTNDADNSGTLKYVRIEYAGTAVNPGDEVNGLTLYTVGSGTTIDHIQVVRGYDDAFEFFGGTVNCKYLVAYNTADDDFDFDDGYRGKIQYAISIKDPKFADDKKGKSDYSNNMEVDNSDGKNLFTIEPNTFPVLSNFTLIGANNATGTVAEAGYNMRWRRGAKFIMGNSIALGGQKAGLDLDDTPTAQYYKDGISGFKNSLVHAVANVYKTDLLTGLVYTAEELKADAEGRDGSKSFANAADVKLSDPFNNAAPGLVPQTGSPAIAAGKYEGALNDGFFDKTNFLGAVDPANDWTKGQWLTWGR